MTDRADKIPGQWSSRRSWLRTVGGTMTGSALMGAAGRSIGPAAARAQDVASETPLIVRSSQPLDLETPVEVFTRFLTPNDLFFVRSHFGAPAVTLGPWRLEVRGLVERPLMLSLAELAKFEQVEAPAVLQCAGNGRSNFTPVVPGLQWDRGAVGNASWTGVRLADLLRRAGLKVGAEEGHVHLLGADAPPSVKTPMYLRSIPLARALDPSTLVATRMDADQLPLMHGGPMRLVVPGWAGNHWIKWLRSITVAREEAPGTYQQTGYRMPKVPTPPGVDLKPTDLVPLTTMPVKSLVARPVAGARLPAGRIDVRGVAWTGMGHVTKVEVATGRDGPWQAATFLSEPRPFTWRLWRYTIEGARPGRLEIRARATDSAGEAQPEVTPWNRSGYLWNGIDTVQCEVV
jgi:DMSO/TMAO reductase YedYZ molybdopterin-dependent catalytic subunit